MKYNNYKLIMDILYEISKQLSFKYKMLIKVLSKKLYGYIKIYEIENKYALIVNQQDIVHFPDLVVLYFNKTFIRTPSNKLNNQMHSYIYRISLQLKGVYIYDDTYWHLFQTNFTNLELLYSSDYLNLSTLFNKPKLKHLISDYIYIDVKPEKINDIFTFKLKTLLLYNFINNNNIIPNELIELIKNMPIEAIAMRNKIQCNIFKNMHIKYLKDMYIKYEEGDEKYIFEMKVHHLTMNKNYLNGYFEDCLKKWKLTSLSLRKNVNLTEYNDVLPLHTLRVDKYIPELNNDVHTLIVDKCDVIYNLQPHILHVGGNHYDILPNLKNMPELKKLVYNGEGDLKRYNLRGKLDEDMDKYHDEEYQEHNVKEKIKKKVRKILPNTEIEFVNN